MKENLEKSLLERFVSGDTTSAETETVNRFLALPEGKLILKEFFIEHWNQASSFEVDEQVLVRLEIELRKRLNIITIEADISVPMGSDFPEPKEIILSGESEIESRKWFRRQGFLKYAAVWAFLILSIGFFGIWKFISNNNETTFREITLIEKTTPKGKRSIFKLEDGTNVILGPGSSLKYPHAFTGNKREVKLYGEAYFEVTKNPDMPFIVYTGDIRTQVLGTSFKINDYDGELISVSVATGKVRVDRLANGKSVEELAVLNPGERVSYFKSQDVAQTSVCSVSELNEWKNGKVLFNATPFYQLIKELDRWYDIDVVFKENHLYNEAITVTLDTGVPLRELLNSLSAIMGLRYEIEGKRVTLY